MGRQALAAYLRISFNMATIKVHFTGKHALHAHKLRIIAADIRFCIHNFTPRILVKAINSAKNRWNTSYP